MDKYIETVKQMVADGQVAQDVAEKYFPELAESEDEKIRQKIIEAIKGDMVVGGTKDKEAAIAWLEKQGEQKPVIQSKFNVGEWVVFNEHHDSVYQVEKIENYQYTLRHTLGGSMPLPFNSEGLIRLWTIQDAKDGDVLASELCDSIILYKGIEDSNVQFYCDFDFSEIDVPGDRFSINNGQHYGNVEDLKDFHPATKEQRDLLFAKMKEEGYELVMDRAICAKRIII